MVGAGDYVDDLSRIAGRLQAMFVRSPLAHARITAIDTGEAEAEPGVVARLHLGHLGAEPVPMFARGQQARAAVRADRRRGAVRG